MGFFNVLGRLIKGQPAFVVEDPKQKTTLQPTAQSAQPAGPKVYPQVYIEQVRCRMQGAEMDLEVDIHNHSQGQVELDKIEIFGRRQELDIFLRPGEERECNVFEGPRPTTTNQTSCRIFYKDATGDYFASEHYIEFKQEADRTYSVNRIRFVRVLDV